MLRVVAIWICLYLLCLAFSFLSEIANKKRSLKDVQQNWKPIVIQTSVTFIVFVIASYLWHLWGPKTTG